MKTDPPPSGQEPVEAPVPWFVRAAQDMAGKGDIVDAQNIHERPGSPTQLARWQTFPPTSDAGAALPVPEPEVDEDGVLRMRGPLSDETPAADIRDVDYVFEEPADAASKMRAPPASGHLHGLVIAGLALAIAVGSTVLVARQSGGDTTEVPPPRLEAPAQSAMPLVRPAAGRVDPADLLPPAASPAKETVAAAKPLKPHAQRSDDGVVAVSSPSLKLRSRPQRLASAVQHEPDTARASPLPARSAEAVVAATASADAPPIPPAAAARERAAAADAPVALAMAEEAGRGPEPATADAPPRRRRAGLPQCKGFQVYRPTTPCRIDAPR